MDESPPRDDVANQRAIIDRRAVDADLRALAEGYDGPADNLRRAALDRVKAAMAAGRAEIRRRFELKQGAPEGANG
ncbi:MAG: hypothetical protein ING19_11855, partial [Azospirillum sp.]|nr:hypothetical protein [Azospirillum sp.]